MIIRIVRERSRQVTPNMWRGKQEQGVVGIFYYERARQHQVARAWRLARLFFLQLLIFIQIRLFWRFFLLLNFLKKYVFWYRIYLLLFNWCRHSIEPRTLPCPFKQSNLSASVTLELTPHTYTPVRDTLCFSVVVCSPQTRSRRVIRIMSIEAFVMHPQGHCFSITETMSKKLCTRCCWRNMVCPRSAQSSWKWGKDWNEASTPTETSGPLAQDCCCATSLGGSAKKRRGNVGKYRHVLWLWS